MNDDIGIALGSQLERIAVALEAIQAHLKPSELAAFHQGTQPEMVARSWSQAPAEPTTQSWAAASTGPVDPEPPFPPAPSQEFRQSRDLPAQPFAEFPRWQCPIHHGSKVVPAGVSKKTGKPYQAFVACSEPGCNEKPPFPGPRR